MPYGLVSHGQTGFDQTYGPNSNCSWRGDFSSLPDPPDGTAKARFWVTRISLGAGDRLLFYAGTSIYDELAAEIAGPLNFMATLQGREIEVSQCNKAHAQVSLHPLRIYFVSLHISTAAFSA